MTLFDLCVKISVDDQASSAVSKLSNKLEVGLKNAAEIGAKAVDMVSTAMKNIASYSVSVGSTFEAQMSKVSAISGAVGDEFEALKEKAVQLGIDTQFSSTEAAQAFEYMATAGWKTEQMLDGVEGIMNLAAAAGENLAKVSAIVTDAITAFGMSAEDSARFADVLATAAAETNTDVAKLGYSFKYVAPIAGTLGYSIEDVSVALGLMANSGIKATQAGTALRGALASMVKPTDVTLNAMIDLGLATEDTLTVLENSDGTAKKLAQTMDMLRKAFEGLNEVEQAEAATRIFGREAMSGMLAIINASEDEYNKLSAAINNANGSAAAMAETMIDNLQGQFTLLESSAEGFGLAIYEDVKKPLTDLTKYATSALNELTNAYSKAGFAGAFTQIGEILIDAYNRIEEAVTTKFPEIENVKTVFNTIIDVFENVAKKAEEVFPVVKNNVANAFERISATIKPVTDNVKQLIEKFKEYLSSGEAAQDVTGFLENSVRFLGDAISGLANFFAIAVEKVREFVEWITSGAVSSSSFLANISALTAGLLTYQLATKAVSAAMLILEGIQKAVAAAQALMNAVMNANPFVLVATLVAALVAGFVTFIATNEDLREAVIKVWNQVKAVASDVWGGIADFFTETIPNAVKEMLQWLRDLPSKMGEIALDIINSLIEGFKNGWDSLVDWLSAAVSEIFGGLFGNIATSGTNNADGSHANGLNYVPFDGYLAELHRGEMVLTKADATRYRENGDSKKGSVVVNQYINSRAMTAADLMEEAMYEQERAILMGI